MCVCWGWHSGASISVHVFLGPKKNPQLAVLSQAPPNLNHIPPFPEPTLGGPSKPASTPPFPPVGRPNPRPHWTAKSENEGHTTSSNSWKAPCFLSACSHPGRRIDSLFFSLCLAAQRTKLSHLPVNASWKWRSFSLSYCSPSPLDLSNIIGIFIPPEGFINIDMVIWVTVVDQQWQDGLAGHVKFLLSLSCWALYLFRQGMYRWRPFFSHQNE